ncbi:MAG: hypothetical protein MR598_07575 [Erysipelotrichaceae bacterium]|nr:hypothetical protein [Erysipelotrichaceae bacterium]
MERLVDAVYLSRNDVTNLQRKLIGKGTDGSVYDVGNGYLYKIYHDGSLFSDIKVQHPLLDDYEDDVKIYQMQNSLKLNRKESHFRYMDRDGVRITGEEAIYRAIQRQKYIHYTQLPLAPIYVNSRFKGCVLKKHSFHFQLYSFSFLSLEKKKRLLSLIVDRVEELVQYYIYPLDVFNRPNEKSLSHSNILVSLRGIPELIDVDGASTVYLEETSSNLLFETLNSLNILVLEYLYDLEIPDEMLDEDILELEQFLFKRGISEKFVSDLAHQEADFSTLRKILKR